MTQRLIHFASIALLAFSTTAHADYSTPAFDALKTRIRESQSQCAPADLQGRTSECALIGLEIKDLFTTSPSSLDPVAALLLPRLSWIAEDQAGIWSDTILEGDYGADGKTRLDRVQGIYLDHILIAYRITYSERAWTIEEDERIEGRIVESSFVSRDLSAWFRDDRALAVFVPNP